MKNNNKLRIGLFIGIVVFGLGMVTWMNTASSSVKANSTNAKQANSAKILDPVENTEGLSATAKRVVLSQDEAFPDIATEEGRKLIFSKQDFPGDKKEVSYEYSDAKGTAKKPSSANAGFQLVYVKVSDKSSKSNILVPIPVTVTNSGTTLLSEDRVAIQMDNGQDQIQLQLNEVKDKNAEELQQIVKEKAQVRAWRTDNGEELPVAVSENTIDPSVAGTYKATFKVTLDSETVQMEKEVKVEESARALNPAPRAEDGFTWKLLPARQNASLYDMKRSSFFRMSNGDTSTSNLKSYASSALTILPDKSVGYDVARDSASIFGGFSVGASTVIPSVNGTLLPSVDEQSASLSTSVYQRSDGLGIRKELINTKLGLKYTYEATVATNQSYRVQTKIENISSSTVTLGFINKGILSSGSRSSFAQKSALSAIGNGRGVKGRTKINSTDEMAYAIDFKPRVDDPYTYWDVVDKAESGNSSEKSAAWERLNRTALKPGMEKTKFKSGDTIFSEPRFGFFFSGGVPARTVASGESVSGTWELFYGEPLPYIEIGATPEEHNVYPDTTEQEFKYDYVLGNMPSNSAFGTMTVTYPDNSKEARPFTAANPTGTITVPRTKLPEQLSNKPGTIQSYETSLLAINESEGIWQGLPSEDKILSVNVYNLGGSPIAQIVKKDSIWSKKPWELISNPVILPGHDPDYKFVNPAKPVDTSKVGMQFTEVIMTDTAEPTRSVIIKVPVMVTTEDPIPTNGLYIGADDFTIDQEELKNLTEAQIPEMILKNSNAAAWDAATGSSEGIDLFVKETTLSNTSDNSKIYTAKIRAENADEFKEKTVNITVTAKSKLTINFIDEKNTTLKTIEVTKEIGRPTDLSKDPDVIQVLQDLEADNRKLEERPANETAYPIAATNQPVNYRFRSYSKWTVEFVTTNDDGEQLLPSVELEKRIGITFNMREEEPIAAALKTLELEKHYDLMSFPQDDESFTVSASDNGRVLPYVYEVEANINIHFVDEKDTTIKTVPLIRRVGLLDLSQDPDILAAIQTLKEQKYEVIKSPENVTAYPIRFDTDVTNPIIYQVKKMEVPVNIRFVDEDGVDIPKVEPINSKGIIGTPLDLQQFDTEIQKRLEILKGEHYELVEKPADNQVITGPGALDVFYRFKGSLFIGSFPGTLDFGNKYMDSNMIKAEQPKYDKDLVIKDTRKTKGSWKLSATLEKPLTSEENPGEVINNVFFYKQDATTKVPLLKGQAQPIETGKATTSGEYNVSEKWTNNKTGLELIVHSNNVYQTGKYTASILWQVETTP
ncbi:hypothetical protein ABID30_002020 [Enterococcus rotai]|uniref:MucBP domain-containing protein n=1 Tax=Enterococcus rotai TaxID=118060 RepID=A0A0U2X9N9_9ENTE|nr:hypothetical protein [Enterococcus rotai]ALS36784.1 hypothetical protein ATZ35_06325 [Enterococcus rotai]